MRLAFTDGPLRLACRGATPNAITGDARRLKVGRRAGPSSIGPGGHGLLAATAASCPATGGGLLVRGSPQGGFRRVEPTARRRQEI